MVTIVLWCHVKTLYNDYCKKKLTETSPWAGNVLETSRARRRTTCDISTDHGGHQHLLVSKKAITQGGKVGHFLVETLTMLLPNLTLHVKLFLFTIFDELFSRSKILKTKNSSSVGQKNPQHTVNCCLQALSLYIFVRDFSRAKKRMYSFVYR